MSIKQLHLKFPVGVTRPEIEAAMKEVYAEWGRRGGRSARMTEARRKSARELMYTINQRKKLAKEMGLKAAGVEHVYFNENDDFIKAILELKEKVTKLERIAKKKTLKSPSRARGKITKKRGSHGL